MKKKPNSDVVISPEEAQEASLKRLKKSLGICVIVYAFLGLEFCMMEGMRIRDTGADIVMENVPIVIAGFPELESLTYDYCCRNRYQSSGMVEEYNSFMAYHYFSYQEGENMIARLIERIEDWQKEFLDDASTRSYIINDAVRIEVGMNAISELHVKIPDAVDDGYFYWYRTRDNRYLMVREWQ